MQEKICIRLDWCKRFDINQAALLTVIEKYVDENGEWLELIDDMKKKLLESWVKGMVIDRFMRWLHKSKVITYLPRYDYNDPIDEIRWYIRLDRDKLEETCIIKV